MFERTGTFIDDFLSRSLFDRGGGSADLRRSGKGIAERHSRFEKEWQPHLDSCRRVQREWAAGLTPDGRESLLVFGAGRLFDFEKRLLAAPEISTGISTFRQTTFIDADSGCLPSWHECRRQFAGGSQLNFELLELTGRLKAWRQELPTVLRHIRPSASAEKWRAALAEIVRIGRGEGWPDRPEAAALVQRLKSRAPAALLSLNLLSQLPLAWQRTVEESLIRIFGARYTAERENEWLAAYRSGAETILREHAALLCILGAQSILLITDITYLHPIDSRTVELEDLRWQFEPVAGDPLAPLAPNSGRYIRAADGGPAGVVLIDALVGSGLLERQKICRNFPGYVLESSESWLWQIVPRSGGRESRPELHRVAALRFGQSGRAAGS